MRARRSAPARSRSCSARAPTRSTPPWSSVPSRSPGERGRRGRARVLLPAAQPGLSRRRPASTPPLLVLSRTAGPTGDDRCRSFDPEAAVLDHARLRRARRQLRRQHRLRPRLPRAAERQLGRRRRRRLRRSGAPGHGSTRQGRSGTGWRSAAAAPAATRRWRRWPSATSSRRAPACSASATWRSLARDTHKFESRYLDRLVGPYPEAQASSTSSVADPPRRPAQLPDDPAAGARRPGGAAEPGRDDGRRGPGQGSAGRPVVFDGEEHGFRKAENIVRALEAEPTSTAGCSASTSADDVEPVEIENLPDRSADAVTRP